MADQRNSLKILLDKPIRFLYTKFEMINNYQEEALLNTVKKITKNNCEHKNTTLVSLDVAYYIQCLDCDKQFDESGSDLTGGKI